MQMKKSDESVERFWDRYIEQVRQKGVKEPFDRWYVIRVQEYIKANEGRRLADHRPMDVETFLGDESRRSRLKPWQFVQVVDAIQTLFCGIVSPPWVNRGVRFNFLSFGKLQVSGLISCGLHEYPDRSSGIFSQPD